MAKSFSVALRSAILLLAFSITAPARAGESPAFIDVLDMPAAANPLAAGTLINGLARAGDRLLAAGARGAILYSDDAGQHWRQASVPVSSDLLAVRFIDRTQGWAVGHDGVILHSTDAGAHWVRQLDGRSATRLLRQFAQSGDSSDLAYAEAARLAEQGPDKPFLDICFEDSLHGYAVGAFNLLFHTDDGGHTWQPWGAHIDNPQGLHLNAIGFADGDLFIAAEQGKVFRLDRSRQRFEVLATPYTGSFFGLLGSTDAVLMFGLRGNAWRSTDRGNHWTRVDTGLQASLTAATVMPDGRVLLASQAGELLLSDDGGASFRRVQVAAAPIAAVTAAGTNELIVGGPQGLRRQKLK